MQAVVTSIGQYGGAPAFEYEIREESGALVAVDFVVVHAHEGEGWPEVEAVVLAFLRRRAAKHELTEPSERGRRREIRLGGRRLGEVARASLRAPELAAAGGALPSPPAAPLRVSVSYAEAFRALRQAQDGV